MFGNLKIEVEAFDSHIIVNLTRLHDGKTLKDKIEKKFKKVNITNVITVIEGNADSSN